jgi:hypothetical protein
LQKAKLVTNQPKKQDVLRRDESKSKATAGRNENNEQSLFDQIFKSDTVTNEVQQVKGDLPQEKLTKKEISKMSQKTKNNDTKRAKTSKKIVEHSDTPTTTFSFLYSIMPKEILGVSINEIKKDLKESTSQLTSVYVHENFGFFCL